MNEERDKKLVVDYLNGKALALEQLISFYLKPIYNFVYYLIGDRSAAEDITQEVFVKVWRHLKKFKEDKSFQGWIFTIAKNTALDFFKKKKHRSFTDFEMTDKRNSIIDNLVDPEPLPSEIFAQKDLVERTLKAMQQMSLRYQMIIYFHYFQHLSLPEVADILVEPINTVKSLHRRGIIKLRELLKKE